MIDRAVVIEPPRSIKQRQVSLLKERVERIQQDVLAAVFQVKDLVPMWRIHQLQREEVKQNKKIKKVLYSNTSAEEALKTAETILRKKGSIRGPIRTRHQTRKTQKTAERLLQDEKKKLRSDQYFWPLSNKIYAQKRKSLLGRMLKFTRLERKRVLSTEESEEKNLLHQALITLPVPVVVRKYAPIVEELFSTEWNTANQTHQLAGLLSKPVKEIQDRLFALQAYIRNGADVNARTQGKPILEIASESGDLEQMKFLLGLANQNSKDTTLHSVLRHNRNPAQARLLLESGANRNSTYTPFGVPTANIALATGNQAQISAVGRPFHRPPASITAQAILKKPESSNQSFQDALAEPFSVDRDELLKLAQNALTNKTLSDNQRGRILQRLNLVPGLNLHQEPSLRVSVTKFLSKQYLDDPKSTYKALSLALNHGIQLQSHGDYQHRFSGLLEDCINNGDAKFVNRLLGARPGQSNLSHRTFIDDLAYHIQRAPNDETGKAIRDNLPSIEAQAIREGKTAYVKKHLEEYRNPDWDLHGLGVKPDFDSLEALSSGDSKMSRMIAEQRRLYRQYETSLPEPMET